MVAAVVTWLCVAVFSPLAVADVLVVTDSHHPIIIMGGEHVIELDLPGRIEAELSADLPADPGQAEAIVQQRLREGKETLQRRIGRAYQGVADARGLGIAKIPAVVVDRRYVVYGEPDVARAVARIDAHRSARP
ncbi:TIGR03757 family integrating conjugative element protein [Aromatoleum toluclasticum]|uniref:TIGR03757 family integrating conjugative element protein n=1 Tax=Aromatoleum toluclasticum TaxID=92003 RepID=UPI001D18A75F|nr:TIGR03757 family integrating conjugative element protein [Aromatoleum toluclasticum]MCC4113928.1 TIGR03757 family integrating conjugative element protein [Aromatoleum toluclasticum]